MEGSIQNQSRIIRTNGHVLWHVQFPATFQAMMDEIFKHEIEGTLIIVYMDDVLCFASSIEELARIERIVLQKLRKNDLYLKPKKCEFRRPKVEYLGLVVEEKKLAMDPTKLKGLSDWPTPKL